MRRIGLGPTLGGRPGVMPMHIAAGSSKLGRSHRYHLAGTNAEYLAEEERRTFQCAVVSLTMAVAMIIAGAVIMTRADYGGSKAGLVDEYNRVVEAWTSTHAAPFNATTFEIAFGETTVAATRAAPESPIDRAGGAVHTYVPAVFQHESLLESIALPELVAAGTLPPLDRLAEMADVVTHPPSREGGGDGAPPTAGEQKEEDGAGLSALSFNNTAVMEALMTPREVTVLARRTDGGGGGGAVDRISLGRHALVRRDVRRSGGWKMCKYQQAGFYTRGSCVTYAVLDSLCVKVARGADGAWRADPAFGGIGCSPKEAWAPPKTRRLHAPASGRLPSLRSVRALGAGFVTVRSAMDPLITALNMTSGTMFFAEQAAEANATGTVLLIIGLALLVPGSMLSAPYVRRYLRGAVVFHRARALKRDKVDPDVFDDIL